MPYIERNCITDEDYFEKKRGKDKIAFSLHFFSFAVYLSIFLSPSGKAGEREKRDEADR